MIQEIKYFLLGLLQGLTEFFPISSSGHLELYSHISNIVDEEPLLLFITVHFATALSTIIVYRFRIKTIFLGVIRDKNKADISFILKVIVSSIPTLLLYLIFSHHIESLFSNGVILVCVMLIMTGFMLIATNFFRKSNNKINFKHTILIGLSQALAIIPGISRSGATISTALYFGINRKDAAEFSFLIGLVPIIGGTIIKFSEFLNAPSSQNFNSEALLIAFFSAFFSGLLACKYMIVIVENNNLKYFGYYCIVLGVVFGTIFI